MTPTLLICIVAAAVTAVGLFLPARDFPAPPASSSGATEVAIASFTFSETGPLAAGQEVRVVNNDSVAHTLTADNGAFDTGLLEPGEQAVITVPTSPGDYSFFCEVHPAMTGAFTVSG